MEQQPQEISEFLIVFFTLMISLKEQRCEMKDILWKLREVVCLFIIRHVIFTSFPPVVGSCTWLIRAVHSQPAVLWCSSSPCEVLYGISTSSQSPDTGCVCLLTNTHLSFHIYFPFFSSCIFIYFFTYNCVRIPLHQCVFPCLLVHAFECNCANLLHNVCDSDVDTGCVCVIICRIIGSVVTVLWYRYGRPWPQA